MGMGARFWIYCDSCGVPQTHDADALYSRQEARAEAKAMICKRVMVDGRAADVCVKCRDMYSVVLPERIRRLRETAQCS